MSYCTVGDVLDYLGIEQGGGATDNLLHRHVAAAQAAIDAYCHRTFEALADETRNVDSLGDHIRGRALFLDDELCAVTTVTLGDGTELTANDYVTSPRNKPPFNGLRLRHSSGHHRWTYLPDWEGAIQIEGRWAYSLTAPAPIQEACISLAAFYYRQKDQPFTDVTAVEAGVVMRPIGIPAHVRTMLDNGYRKP